MLPISEIYNIILWYISIQIISFLTIPICSFSFRNLKDHGYTISKALGFVIFSFIIFFFCRFLGLPYTDLVIRACLLIFIGFSYLFVLINKQREKNIFPKDFKKYVIRVEFIFLILFILFTFLRTFSPDSDGGEAVMDFAFVNSINRDESLPSNYPWYAGENLENVYYYFGHFLTSNLIKLSSVSSSIGYNLAMVTFFTIFSIGCHGIIYNLTGKHKFGLLAILFLVFMGNMYGFLHIFNTIFPQIDIQMPSYKPVTIGKFFGKLVARGDSDLFWWSTRVIPWTITEVPWFSFLWGDLHAHYISYQFIVMFLTICLNFFLSKKTGFNVFGNNLFEKFLNIFLIGLSLGFMFPQFIWNYPIYFGFTGLVIIFGQFFNENKIKFKILTRSFMILTLILFISFVLFSPSFVSLLKPKVGGKILPEHFKTSIYHFSVILFLQWFLINGFLLDKIYSFKNFKNKSLRRILTLDIILYLILTFILLISFFTNPERFFESNLKFKIDLKYLLFDFQMLTMLIPTILISTALLFSKKINKKESFVILLVLMGSFIFLGVEIYSIHGRYVFFFKLFPSIWIMWGIAAVYSIYHLKGRFNFKTKFNRFFTIFLYFIIFFSLIPYLIIGTYNITDGFRYSFGRDYPSIDGLAFMKQAHRSDYQAIQWINKNIKKSPIILEYVGYEYTYASRVSSFTGLPTLVGWRFHSSQLTGLDVSVRENDVHEIYNTTENDQAVELLKKYNISYIFVGELEKRYYDAQSLKKFPENQKIYNLIYSQSEAQIYEVNYGNIDSE